MTPPEIIPAETIQTEEVEPAPRISVRFSVGLALLVAGIVAHHAVWSNGL